MFYYYLTGSTTARLLLAIQPIPLILTREQSAPSSTFLSCRMPTCVLSIPSGVVIARSQRTEEGKRDHDQKGRIKSGTCPMYETSLLI